MSIKTKFLIYLNITMMLIMLQFQSGYNAISDNLDSINSSKNISFPQLEVIDKIIFKFETLNKDFQDIFYSKDEDILAESKELQKEISNLFQKLIFIPSESVIGFEARESFHKFSKSTTQFLENYLKSEEEVENIYQKTKMISTQVRGIKNMLQNERNFIYNQYTSGVEQNEQNSKTSIWFNFVVLGIILVVGLVTGKWISIVMISPILELNGMANKFSKGHVPIVGKVKRKDEIGRLFISFKKMIRSLLIREKILNNIIEILERFQVTKNYGEIEIEIKNALEKMLSRKEYSCIIRSRKENKLVRTFGDPALEAPHTITYTIDFCEDIYCNILINISKTEDEAQIRNYCESVYQAAIVAIQNVNYTFEVEQKQKLQSQMEAATVVQQALIPQTQEFSKAEIGSIYRPADNTGGDWLSFFYESQTDTIYLYCGDVTGHGIPSALVTGVVCGSIRSLHHHFENTDNNYTTAEKISYILESTNKTLVETGQKAGRIMTLFVAAIHLGSGEGVCANAGHNFPLLIRNNKVGVLRTTGPRLGYEIDSQ